MLQSGQNDSNQAPADVAIIEPPPVMRYLVQTTALAVSKKGLEVEKILMTNSEGTEDFNFLRSSDPYHAFYQHSLAVYSSQNHIARPEYPKITNREELDTIKLTFQLIGIPRKDMTTHKESDTINLTPPIKDLPPEPHMMSRKELDTMKLTAQFLARYGMGFWLALTKSGNMDSRFAFMNPDDRRFTYFLRLAVVYSKVLTPCEKLKNSTTVIDGFFTYLQGEKAVGMPMINLNVGVDYFAYMENKELPLLGHPSMMMNRPPQMQPPVGSEGITPKELDTIKVTAQFVARYGMNFWLAVTESRNVDSQFEFMNAGASRSDCFSLLVAAYSKVLSPSEKLRDSTAGAWALVDGFFHRLGRFEIAQELVQSRTMDMAMLYLHAFVGGLECFGNMDDGDCSPIMPPPEHISVMTQMLSGMLGQMMQEPPMPGMSRPPLVPEDQFLAQHPGSCTIRVSVPNVDAAGKVIEITVQSLSENVASLKEKIAGEIQVPANKQKLSGEAGVLKDNMSLAHYNVGVGEILTLSL